jgi:hypothetical protein
LKPQLPGIRIQFDVPKSDPSAMLFRLTAPGIPASAATMDCMAANVNGPGIVGQFQSSSGDPIPWDCLNLGTVSSMISASDVTAGGSIVVPGVLEGAARTFQMLGIATGGSPACAGGDLAALLRSNTLVGLYDLGDVTVTNLFGSGGSVTIPDVYDLPANQTVAAEEQFELLGSCLSQPIGSTGPELGLIYDGQSPTTGAGTIADGPLSGTLPPANGLGGGLSDCTFGNVCSVFTSGGFPDTADATAVGAGNSARLDLLFDVTGIPLSQYNYISVVFSVLEGTTSSNGTTCGTTMTAGTGFSIAIYDNQLGQWATTQLGGPGGTTATTVQLQVQGTVSDFPITEQGGGYVARKYIHVTLRAQDQANGTNTCSALGFFGGHLYLDRIPYNHI